MNWKYNNHKLQINPLHHEEKPLNTNYSNKISVRQSKQSYQLSLLFTMIAKLGRAQSNAYQNKDKRRTSIMRSALNNRSTTRESPPQNGQQPKQLGWGLKCILDHSNLLSSPHPKESPYEIRLTLWFQRRCLKMSTNRQMDGDWSHLYTIS